MTNKPPFAGEGARRVRLGDVCKLSKVRNRDGLCTDVYSVTNSQGFIPSVDYFNKEVFSNELRSYRVVERGMLAYNPSRINVGSIALQNKADCVVVSPLYVVFSVDERRVLPEYLLSFLKCGAGLSQISANSIGTVRNNLKFEGLCNITIVLPSLEAQRRRVLLMREIDRLVRGARSQLSLLDGLVKSRFVEMFGDPAASPKFETCRVEDIADVFVGVVVKPKQYYADDSKNAVKAFRSLNVGEMHIRDNDWVYFTQEGNQAASKSILKSGDILIVRSGYPGTSCIVSSEYEGCNAIDLIIARIKDDGVLPEFLAAFNNSTRMKDLIERMSVGSAQKHFNVGFYKQVEIPLPPIEIQREYLAFQHRVDKSRVVVQKQIEKLQTLYDSLAQEYFG